MKLGNVGTGKTYTYRTKLTTPSRYRSKQEE